MFIFIKHFYFDLSGTNLANRYDVTDIAAIGVIDKQLFQYIFSIIYYVIYNNIIIFVLLT